MFRRRSIDPRERKTIKYVRLVIVSMLTATAVTNAQQVEATTQAAAATRQANAARLEQMNLERNRRLQPLILYGPWIVVVLVIAVVIWGAGRLIPLLELWLADQAPEPEIEVTEFIEGEIYDLHETPSGAAPVAENGQYRLHLSLKDHTVAIRPAPRKD